jgi:hypothetical protein
MIDLSTWNLTIPEEIPAATISTAEVNGGYSSPYFQRVGSTLFFWTPVTGTTTGGSPYPRTELRETLANGSQNNWQYSKGSHYLSASLAVTQVPSSGVIVLGQIHSKDSAAPFAKVVYRHMNGIGYVCLEIREKPTNQDSKLALYLVGVPLSYPFSYSLAISNGNQLTAKLNSKTYRSTISSAWAGQNFYFKAGTYVIDNDGPTSEGGRAQFDALSVRHIQ